MTDLTLNIIKSIKCSGKVWNRAVAEYMSEYSGCPVEDYTETSLNHILKEAFIDYVSTCDNPEEPVRELFDFIENNGARSLGHHIANVLGLTQVRKNDKYINGFRDLKGG